MGGTGTVTPHLQDLNPESRPGSYSHSDDSLPCYLGLPSIFYTVCKRGRVSLLWIKGMGPSQGRGTFYSPQLSPPTARTPLVQLQREILN